MEWTRGRLLVALVAATPLVRADTCPFDGGFSLRINATTCPPTVPIFCGNGLQIRCCPTGTQCAGDGTYSDNYCCSTNDATNASISTCIESILANPRCPPSSSSASATSSDYTLFNINGTYDRGAFCCLSGKDGAYAYLSGDGIGVACVDVDTNDGDPPDNYFWASTAKQATCTASTTAAKTTTAKTTATSGAATGTGSATTTGSSAATTTAAADDEGDSSVSGGAIAGIVVGCLAGVGLVGSAALILYRRRRNQKELDAGESGGHSETADAKYAPVQQSPPMPAPVEMGTFAPPVELGSQQSYAVELDAGEASRQAPR